MAIFYVNRETSEIEEEKILGEVFLNWIYTSNLGLSLLEKIFKKRVFSTFYGSLQKKSFSKRKINKFIQEYGIEMNDFKKPIGDYLNFNDFFIRELSEGARPIVVEDKRLASPADGRILAYDRIDKNKILQIKDSYFTLEDFLGDKHLAGQYDGGSFLVIRLCPIDYHRFHFPDGGIPEAATIIDGDYYSVNPIALYRKPQLYCVNKRALTVFHSVNFGDILYLEVGATCVGSIVQTYSPNIPVVKGQEKGWFEFGGSTVVLLFQPGRIKIDEDLLQNTRNNLETLVKMGTGLGSALSLD